MIRFENVTKYYPTPKGRHYVLRNVSFEIPMGARLGVIGRNGAGKTTLLRLMGGVDTPNAGRITREGLISWPMGLGAGLQPSMTGTQNARFCCRIQGVPLKDIPAMVEGMREFSELGKFFDLPASTYSSGMKGRLKFAIAMAFDFDCYIIDELTSTGDGGFRDKSAAVFREKRARASFIKVSHSTNELLAECNSGMVLERGKLRYFDDIKEAVGFYQNLIGGDKNAKGKKSGPRPRGAGDKREAVMAAAGATANGGRENAGSPGQPGNQPKLNGQGQAERRAQRQAAQQRRQPPRTQANVASPPLITPMGGPLHTSYCPAPMAPRSGKRSG